LERCWVSGLTRAIIVPISTYQIALAIRDSHDCGAIAFFGTSRPATVSTVASAASSLLLLGRVVIPYAADHGR
jgi:hypothetical protein